jgi:hypothetical protein
VLLAPALSAHGIPPRAPGTNRAVRRAAHALGYPGAALRGGRALLALDPVDPAGVHFDVARAAFALGERELARRQVLLALEEAPRFRAAHRLLLELQQ